MKTIIVATDFSPESGNAVEYAAGFAQKTGARIILFNSFTIPLHVANTMLPAEALDHLIEENKILLKEKCEAVARKFSIDVKYEAELMVEVSEELERLYKKYDADLIVMGMAGNSVAQDIFGNTTTSAIMKHSYPVLAIPEKVKFDEIKNILFAYDELKEGKHEISAKVKEIADFFSAKIEVFHVQPKPEENCSREIEEEFKESEYEFKEVKSEEIIKEIESEIKKLPADMLVMIPQKYNFWESLVHRSKTRMMASRSSVPVLSIPLLSPQGEGGV
ncbi:universal stress protein [Salegentibacter sp. F188]|uniref:Universal stress protein n=1 Tax=Autumnicola patrickiae TaxID=3075591 RepID=A0ABU3DWY3_9FLAO|nr:universal stress protein [Salegentibacter sp. F188]MDT0688224.1 universal stress protein [Salegentibacter sp. F188]